MYKLPGQKRVQSRHPPENGGFFRSRATPGEWRFYAVFTSRGYFADLAVALRYLGVGRSIWAGGLRLDNPGAKARGMKQPAAVGGIILQVPPDPCSHHPCFKVAPMDFSPTGSLTGPKSHFDRRGSWANLEGLTNSVNAQVGEIAVQVGTTPAAWHAGVFPDPPELLNGDPADRRAGADLCCHL